MPEKHTSELSELILKCRIERGLTLLQFAKAVKMSGAGISKIERGLSKPNRTTEARLVAFLRKYGYFPKTEVAA